jgi:hypothetical protein
MSEHKHKHEWTWYLGKSGSTERHCECGNEDWYAPASSLIYSMQQISQGKVEAEQQLAQARSDREYFVQQAQDYKAQADQARALLEDAVNDWARYMRSDTQASMMRCKLCDFPTDTGDPANREGEKLITQHYHGCLIAQWRTFLAAHPTLGSGSV